MRVKAATEVREFKMELELYGSQVNALKTGTLYCVNPSTHLELPMRQQV